MPKIALPVRLEADLYERLARVAKADQRSVAQTAAMAIALGLPKLENALADKLKSLNEDILPEIEKSKLSAALIGQPLGG